MSEYYIICQLIMYPVIIYFFVKAAISFKKDKFGCMMLHLGASIFTSLVTYALFLLYKGIEVPSVLSGIAFAVACVLVFFGAIMYFIREEFEK